MWTHLRHFCCAPRLRISHVFASVQALRWPKSRDATPPLQQQQLRTEKDTCSHRFVAALLAKKKKKKKKNCSEMKCRALPEIYPPPRWWSVDNVKLWSIWPAALPKLLALKYYAHFKMPPLVCCLVPYVALRTHSQRPNGIHCAAALHVNAFRKFIASGFNGH